MKFIQTATNLTDIVEAHRYYTGRDFYSNFENVEREHTERYSDITEWFLGDDERIYFIFNFDRGNGIIEHTQVIHNFAPEGSPATGAQGTDQTYFNVGWGKYANILLLLNCVMGIVPQHEHLSCTSL